MSSHILEHVAAISFFTARIDSKRIYIESVLKAELPVAPMKIHT